MFGNDDLVIVMSVWAWQVASMYVVRVKLGQGMSYAIYVCVLLWLGEYFINLSNYINYSELENLFIKKVYYYYSNIIIIGADQAAFLTQIIT